MKKIILPGFVVATFVLIAIAMPVLAQAQPLTPEQNSNVQAGCHASQNSLRTLQRRDTVLRINRGRLYDLTLRQTGAFVARLDVHKIDAPAIKAADAEMRAEFLRFKENYDKYADNLEQAIAIDCQQKPQEFYDLVAKAVDDRKAVARDVTAIKEQMSTYTNGLRELREKLPEQESRQ